MDLTCIICNKDIAGWPYRAAWIAAVATVVAVAIWTYMQMDEQGMVQDSLERHPWTAVPGLALLCGIAGILAGLVVYADARIVIFFGREMISVRAAVRRALRGGGKSCRWCGHCAGHGGECAGSRRSPGGRAARGALGKAGTEADAADRRRIDGCGGGC